jgi:glutamate/aspartate transport system permease protein
MRYVVLPQAFAAMLPIVLTQCIVIFQDTSLVYVIALGDFFSRAQGIGARDGTIIPMLIFAGGVYWVICSTLSVMVRWARSRRPSA